MKFIFATFLLLSSTLAYAIMDETPDWVSIQVESIVDRQNVLVAARVHNGRLAALKVRLANKTMDIPQPELVGLPALNLQSLRIVSPDVKSGTGSKVRVELENPPTQDLQKKIKVQFFFSDQSYQGRIVEQGERKELTRELKEPG